jgi:hypothetical protein
MEQNQSLELSEEEKKELPIGLLREWWIAATQALVDTVGTSAALGLLAPGFRHHGRSGYHILARSMGLICPKDVGSEPSNRVKSHLLLHSLLIRTSAWPC